MKAIKIYAQDSKYYMEDLENNQIVELNEIVDDGKTLKLPENSANRRYCSIKKAEECVTLGYKESRTLGPRDPEQTTPKTDRPKAPKLEELVEYLTEDERKIYKELMDKAVERHQKAAKEKLLEEWKKKVAELEEEIRNAK